VQTLVLLRAMQALPRLCAAGWSQRARRSAAAGRAPERAREHSRGRPRARAAARRFTFYITLNRLQQGDAVQWAALLRGTPGRQAGLLYWLYGSADQPANLEVSEPDSSFTLRQHLLTPEQVAAVRALALDLYPAPTRHKLHAAAAPADAGAGGRGARPSPKPITCAHRTAASRCGSTC